MNEPTKNLLLLQAVVPPETPLTVHSQIRILELLGIVSTPELIKAMKISLALIPSNMPATLKGLLNLLASLIKASTKANKGHHDSLSKHLAELEKIPDAPLTYGTFLPICETLLKPTHKKHE
jgi:hypothetical protein